MATAQEIISTAANEAVLVEWFSGIASCEYLDGSSYQLYLDLDDNTLSINQEASDQSWLQRDDGSLVMISKVSGYSDTPEDERYTDECDLNDYGYGEFVDQIEEKITEVLSA